jgi:hypothetical protein
MALLTISEHVDSFDTLPFINPLLWLDWVSIFDIVEEFFPLLAIFSCIIGAGLYGVCFWLTIGYGLRGFGTRQYDILVIPYQCQALESTGKRINVDDSFFVCIPSSLQAVLSGS